MKNNRITLKDLRKAIKLINLKENIKNCELCKHRGDDNYTFCCLIHNYMQISKQQRQEIKNIFGF